MSADLKKNEREASTIGLDAPQQSDGGDSRVSVSPEMRLSFASHGLNTPEDFLAMPGEIVSGHPDRHVMRVVLDDGHVCYLKREHRIRWRDQFSNWRAGYGWISKSVREGHTLQYLNSLGFPGPKWLAFGEDGKGRAFLLVDEVGGAVELPRLLQTVVNLRDWAIRLGRFCAELHEAGFDHRDLYAKHFLINRDSDAISLLDWQRTEKQECVSWAQRMRALATLLATLPALESGPFARERFAATLLWAYRCVARGAHRNGVPRFSTFARRIRSEVSRLERRRGIREQQQRPLPEKSQRLVWLEGEAVCAISEVAEELRWPAVRKALYDPSRDQTTLMLSGNRSSRLEVSRHYSWRERAVAWLRGKSWRAPEMRKARLLFHLERHHVAAPRLLAFGQRFSGWRCDAFILHETAPAGAVPLPFALSARNSDEQTVLLDELVELIRRLHDAGCEISSVDHIVADGATLRVGNPWGLVFRKHLSARSKKNDLRRCARSMMNYCAPTELERFLRLAAETR